MFKTLHILLSLFALSSISACAEEDGSGDTASEQIGMPSSDLMSVSAKAVRLHVCFPTLSISVRTGPSGNYWSLGSLNTNETFDKSTKVAPSGAWVYGYAYGKVNSSGWVQSQYLC